MPSHWKERLRAYIDPFQTLAHALYCSFFPALTTQNLMHACTFMNIYTHAKLPPAPVDLYQTLLTTGLRDLRTRAFAKWFDESSPSPSLLRPSALYIYNINKKPPKAILCPQTKIDLHSQTGPWFTAYESTTPVPRLIACAHGVVLEIGAGSGNQLQRFNWSQIQHVYGVEPNAELCEILRSKLAKESVLPREGMYTVVEGRIEDETKGALADLEGKVDTVVCIQVFCSVEDVEAVARGIYAALRSGGEVVFWEHEASRDWVTRKMQGTCLFFMLPVPHFSILRRDCWEYY